jgi:CheY-like chemotaxis protein
MDPEGMPVVLVVDDDPMILRLLEINFRLEGYRVETAAHGERALELAASLGPRAIILDLMMPGMDGWEVCRRLRDDPATASIPIIALSARAQEEDRQRGYALGVTEYITKPFDPATLVETVRRAQSLPTSQ